ncbi:uncharacterized protein ACJ7VT_007616 [Polymixia lowei]
MWDSKSRFKAQSSVWCGMASVSGSGFMSKISTSPSPGAELRAALEESSFRRAELVQRLREAHGRLDSQTDLLKSRDTQLNHSITTAQLLDMKHKQLAEAVSALEQEKEAAELSRFEESRQRGDLQEKSEKQRADKELCELREALREAKERANTLEEEKTHVLQKLQTSKEAQKTLSRLMEEINQRHSCTMQEQLSEVHRKLGQACLEKDLLSTQVLRLEDSIEDLKTKLSGALSEKDRLIQEKADLYQNAQCLQLQLERAQRGREGFTDQVCELHDQLAEAKSHNNKHDQETVLMKEQLMSVREVNEKLMRELEKVKQGLELSRTQLHELTAEKVINTNQVTALEAERTQLIGEKEELLSKLNECGQAELKEMTERCHQLRESWDALELENQKLQDRCLCLESEVLQKEEELHLKVEGCQNLEAERIQSMDKLKAMASHWNEKWQEVALTLQGTQRELEELKQTDARNKVRLSVYRPHKELCALQLCHYCVSKEDSRLATEVQRLQGQRQKDKEEIESLLCYKANMETELNKTRKESDSLLRVELDACKQELELERSRSQALLHRWKGKGTGGEAAQMLDKETVTELSMSPEMSSTSRIVWQTPSDSNSSQNDSTQVSPQEFDGQHGQMKAELQNVRETLQTRDGELEEQQQVLLSARGQVFLQSEVQGLEQQLAATEKELRGKERALKRLERLRQADKTEAQIRISALELKLVKLNGKVPADTQDGQADVLTTDSLRAQLEESRRRANQLQQEKDQAVQRLQTLRQLHLGKDEKTSLESKKDKTVYPVDLDQDKQRRMVTEQLKNLFKEQEELGKVYDRSAASQTGGSSLQDWTRKSKVGKSALDMLQSQRNRQGDGLRDRGQQQRAGLMPVSEEQEEEDPDWPKGGEAEREEVACLDEEQHNRIAQPS